MAVVRAWCVCVSACLRGSFGFRTLLSQLIVSPTYVFRHEQAVRSHVRLGQGISITQFGRIFIVSMPNHTVCNCRHCFAGVFNVPLCDVIR